MQTNSTKANPLARRMLLLTTRRRQTYPRLHQFICVLLGSDIYCRIPKGLLLPHPYGVIIHQKVTLGENIKIIQQLTLGQDFPGADGVPPIGSYVYICADAKIIGPITIGANAVVTKDVHCSATVIGFNRICQASAAAAQ